MIAAATLSSAELGRLTDQTVYVRDEKGALHLAKVARANLSGARVYLERENPEGRADPDRFAALSIVVPLHSVYLSRAAKVAAEAVA